MKSSTHWIAGVAALAACSYDASQLQGPSAETGGGVSTGGLAATGGLPGSGGVVGSGGASTTGVGGSSGGNAGALGTGGAGGVITNGGQPGSGGVMAGDGGTFILSCGAGAEPCSQPTDVWGIPVTGGGVSYGDNFNTTGTVCHRTADDIVSWGCSNFAGWSLKVNGQAVACDGTSGINTLPPKVGSFYYFEATSSAGAASWASLWWGGKGHAGPYPSCASSAVK